MGTCGGGALGYVQVSVACTGSLLNWKWGALEICAGSVGCPGDKGWQRWGAPGIHEGVAGVPRGSVQVVVEGTGFLCKWRWGVLGI